MRVHFIAAAIAVALPGMALAQTPAPAVAANPADVAAATKFIEDLSGRVFTILRDRSESTASMKPKFRSMLRDNFALDEIGARLIRRHRATATPQQLAAYQAALPQFIVNAYSDRLAEYTSASIRTIRAQPRGSRGDIDVHTRITTPGSNQAFDAVWTVRRTGGRLAILNLTVAGINLTLTQEADFTAFIQRKGFDALVAFMKSANAKDLAA